MGGVWTGRWPLPFSTFEDGEGKAKILKVHRVYRAGNDLRRSSPSDLGKDTLQSAVHRPSSESRSLYVSRLPSNQTRPTNGSNVVPNPHSFRKISLEIQNATHSSISCTIKISFCRQFYPFTGKIIVANFYIVKFLSKEKKDTALPFTGFLVVGMKPGSLLFIRQDFSSTWTKDRGFKKFLITVD